jgi:hypothetical protein
MRDRNNPLRSIPDQAFTIIQASHEDFHKYLADIPARYPGGRITCINNHRFVPLLKVREEYQDRLDHRIVPTLDELLALTGSDRSAILFIEYHPLWFGIDRPDEVLLFNEVCRNRARQGGPVVLITAVMDRALLALDGKADHFFQIGKIQFRRGKPVNRAQTCLDTYQTTMQGVKEKGRLLGQTRLGEW